MDPHEIGAAKLSIPRAPSSAHAPSLSSLTSERRSRRTCHSTAKRGDRGTTEAQHLEDEAILASHDRAHQHAIQLLVILLRLCRAHIDELPLQVCRQQPPSWSAGLLLEAMPGVWTAQSIPHITSGLPHTL